MESLGRIAGNQLNLMPFSIGEIYEVNSQKTIDFKILFDGFYPPVHDQKYQSRIGVQITFKPTSKKMFVK
jgi:hypothetical protein